MIDRPCNSIELWLTDFSVLSVIICKVLELLTTKQWGRIIEKNTNKGVLKIMSCISALQHFPHSCRFANINETLENHNNKENGTRKFEKSYYKD